MEPSIGKDPSLGEWREPTTGLPEQKSGETKQNNVERGSEVDRMQREVDGYRQQLAGIQERRRDLQDTEGLRQEYMQRGASEEEVDGMIKYRNGRMVKVFKALDEEEASIIQLIQSYETVIAELR